MRRRIMTITLILAATWAGRAWWERNNVLPPAPQMQRVPRQLGQWRSVRDSELPLEVRRVLRADSVLLRDYELTPESQVQLFVAYYRTQHAGESMHSPRNCLPGSGWQPISQSLVKLDLGKGTQEWVNRYVVERDGQRLLVVYWYQEHDRTVADEYLGKTYLMWDSIRWRRRDGAIVRTSVPLWNGLSEEQGLRQLATFIRMAAPEIRSVLFSTAGETSGSN